MDEDWLPVKSHVQRWIPTVMRRYDVVLPIEWTSYHETKMTNMGTNAVAEAGRFSPIGWNVFWSCDDNHS